MGTKAENQLRPTEKAVFEMTEQSTCSPRKPGPVRGTPTRKYNVLIEEALGDWAKGEPGGLSEMVRRLLKAEREKQVKSGNNEKA